MSDEKRHKQKNENRKPFAKKSFGQNFLVDENYIDKIIGALSPQADEVIVEIGAGRGALTEKLLNKSAKVIAVELDRDLIPLLNEKFGRFENFHLVEQDALKIDFLEIAETENRKLKLVANLPYYISTAILQKLIEQRAAFSKMVLMFQREVVRRITAEAGDSERGFLTVLVQAYLQAEKLFDVPPQAFRPAPKVWSSVTRLITTECNEGDCEKKDSETENGEIEICDEKLFREIISCGFAQKRKTILNNLKNFSPSADFAKVLEICGIEPNRRAESLSITEWKNLYFETGEVVKRSKTQALRRL